MRIFVTGGNGFIGSAVVRQLIEQGHEVKCLMRATSDISRIQNLAFEKTWGDVRDQDSLHLGMNNCEAVVHLASLSNWNDICSPLMHDVVVTGSQNVLDAAKKTGNLRTIFVSSVAAINGTKTPIVQNEKSACTLDLNKYTYAKAKVAVEKMCQEYHLKGLPVVIVNPGEVYGPQDTSLNTAGNLLDIAKSSPVLVCHGGTSVVHVDDVADGIIAAIKKGRSGERYILGGDNLSVRELAQTTLKLIGKNKKIIDIPNSILSTAAFVADKLGLPFPINPKVVPYAMLYWFMDNKKAREELGITFRGATETLAPTLQWLATEKYI